MNYRNLLCLRHDGKGIPYPAPGDPSSEGDRNHGFVNLKRDISKATSIPELKRDPALLSLALALNDSDSGFFSLGSTSAPIADENGHRWTGYIEFAINSRTSAAKPQSYFPLFFDFDLQLPQISELGFQCQNFWELMGADFLDVQYAGFTCAIVINTYYVASAAQASSHWIKVISLLKNFFETRKGEQPDPIYSPDSSVPAPPA